MFCVEREGGGGGDELNDPKFDDRIFEIGAWNWGWLELDDESPNKLLKSCFLRKFDWGWLYWRLEVCIGIDGDEVEEPKNWWNILFEAWEL